MQPLSRYVEQIREFSVPQCFGGWLSRTEERTENLTVRSDRRVVRMKPVELLSQVRKSRRLSERIAFDTARSGKIASVEIAQLQIAQRKFANSTSFKRVEEPEGVNIVYFGVFYRDSVKEIGLFIGILKLFPSNSAACVQHKLNATYEVPARLPISFDILRYFFKTEAAVGYKTPFCADVEGFYGCSCIWRAVPVLVMLLQIVSKQIHRSERKSSFAVTNKDLQAGNPGCHLRLLLILRKQLRALLKQGCDVGLFERFQLFLCNLDLHRIYLAAPHHRAKSYYSSSCRYKGSCYRRPFLRKVNVLGEDDPSRRDEHPEDQQNGSCDRERFPRRLFDRRGFAYTIMFDGHQKFPLPPVWNDNRLCADSKRRRA